MFYASCVNCLCKVCDRTKCRYPCDICFPRCAGSERGRAVMCCPDFQHAPRKQRYMVRKKKTGVKDYIKKMSVHDFFRMVGEIYDDQRDRDHS